MVKTCGTIPITTLDTRALRKLLKGLGNGAMVITENGNYHQSIAEEAKLCWYVGIGGSKKRLFYTEEDKAELEPDGEIAFFKLETPVLCIIRP